MADSAFVVIAFGVLTLTAAFFVPFFIDTTTTGTTTRANLSEGEIVELTDKLEAENIEVNDTNDGITDNVTVELQDQRSLATNRSQINLSQKQGLTLSNETINVTVESATNNHSLLTFNYSTMYGWSDGAVLFWENIQMLLVLFGVVMILSGFKGVY